MGRLRAAVGSAVFLLVAPGVVAGLVPWLLTGWRSSHPPVPVAVLGLALIALGTGVLLHAFVRIVVEGRGTRAPIAPTKRLVVGGLYRHVIVGCDLIPTELAATRRNGMTPFRRARPCPLWESSPSWGRWSRSSRPGTSDA